MNILPLVMQYFTPIIMNKIAGSLGINSTLAQRAIASAAPAILAGIIGKVMQPGGAKVLGDLLAKQDPTILGKLGEMIGTGKQAAVVEQGTSALGGLLGNSVLGSLAGALSKQAGLGSGASNTLLGLVAPAILGTLGREQKSAGLDAAGLANELMGQKQAIADAIPADFAKLLAGTGLLDGVQGKTADTTRTAAAPASTTSAKPAMTTGVKPMSAAKPGVTMPSTTGMPQHHFNWFPWVVSIALLSGLWWLVHGDKVTKDHATVAIPADVPQGTTLATAPVMPDIIGKTDAGKTILAIIEDTRGAVAGVRDVGSAQTALPRLQEIVGKLDKANALAGQLGPEARRALATYLTSQTSLMKTSAANVLAVPGVGPILKPVLDQVIGRFETLSKG